MAASGISPAFPVVGPFRSRENLQHAALEQAGQVFRAAVPAPLASMSPGAARLARLIDAWIDYLAECRLPGGCFVTAASAELDGRPGILRDRLRAVVADWRSLLIAEIAAAQAETALSHRPPEEIATVLIGISMAVNEENKLLEDESAAHHGRTAMRNAAGLPPSP